MITNWSKKRDGVYKGFIVFLENEEDKTEIYDTLSWGEWIASHFVW
jgi:hypothetical protein